MSIIIILHQQSIWNGMPKLRFSIKRQLIIRSLLEIRHYFLKRWRDMIVFVWKGMFYLKSILQVITFVHLVSMHLKLSSLCKISAGGKAVDQQENLQCHRIPSAQNRQLFRIVLIRYLTGWQVISCPYNMGISESFKCFMSWVWLS